MPSPGLQSFVGSWYSVIAYGASGSGNTNDTTAIQAAMTAANANGGGTVVVPAGTYRLDSSLSWTGLTNVCLWLGTGASFTGVGTVTAASGTNNSIFDQRTTSGGGGSGTVTSVTGTSPISVATGTTTPAISFDGTAALSQSNTITGTAIGASGLTGAASAVRIVGRNASGTPASGTFAAGDVVINTDGTEYVCTVAGTPGTWVALNPGYGTPVNIDASLTSLSTGSLTTVARADHVHTVSNVRVLIASASLSSTTATYTFSNIPSTFFHLELIISARSTLAGVWDGCYITFNSDTYGTGTTYWGGDGGATSTYHSMFSSYVHGTTNSYSGPAASALQIRDYSSTTLRKTLHMFAVLNNTSSGTSTGNAGPFGALWNNTSAISSIKLQLSNASFASGSRFQLYGY